MPRAIFFDFDGVIVDSTDIKVQAFRDLYGDQPDHVIDRIIAYHKANEGISRVVKIRHCHREFLGVELDDGEHDRLCREYAKIVEGKVVSCPEVTGATAFLQFFHHQCRMYVVSGTPQEELRRIIKQRGLDGYFEAVYGSPAEKDIIVNAVLADKGLAGADCLFIGDAMTDYRAAAATSVPFIGRIGRGEADPFPERTRTINDLNALAEMLLPG